MSDLRELQSLVKLKFERNKDFAEKLDISAQTVSLYLNGKRNITLSVAKKMAEVLEINDYDTFKRCFFSA